MISHIEVLEVAVKAEAFGIMVENIAAEGGREVAGAFVTPDMANFAAGILCILTKDLAALIALDQVREGRGKV